MTLHMLEQKEEAFFRSLQESACWGEASFFFFFCIQYPVINHNGKEYENMYMYNQITLLYIRN